MTTTDRALPVDQDTILERMRRFMADALDSDLERRADTLAEVLDHEHFAEVLTDGFTNPAPDTAPTVDHVVDVYLDNTLDMVRKQIRQTALLMQRLSELAWVLGRADLAEQLIPDGDRLPQSAKTAYAELVTYCTELGIGLPDGEDIEAGKAQLTERAS